MLESASLYRAIAFDTELVERRISAISLGVSLNTFVAIIQRSASALPQYFSKRARTASFAIKRVSAEAPLSERLSSRVLVFLELSSPSCLSRVSSKEMTLLCSLMALRYASIVLLFTTV